MAALAIITTRDFVLADYERAVALWNKVEGLEVCEGDSREEISEYLKRDPSLAGWRKRTGRWPVSRSVVMTAGAAGFIIWQSRGNIAAVESQNC